MLWTLTLGALLFVAAAQANQVDSQKGERLESEDTGGDTVAYESFGSPVYGPSDAVAKSGGLPPPGKSAYSGSVPSLAGLPASYSSFLNSLAYGYGNAYNRYGMMPYAAPYGYGMPYGYGAYGALPYGAGALGYGAGVLPGLGYPAGLPYNSPLLGRSAYNVYGYPGYPGLGYRFGGVAPAGLRGPVAGPLPGPLPAAVAAPPPVPAAPVAPAPLPVAPVFRAPVTAVTGKDGTLRYGYGPALGQRAPLY